MSMGRSRVSWAALAAMGALAGGVDWGSRVNTERYGTRKPRRDHREKEREQIAAIEAERERTGYYAKVNAGK